MVVTVVVVVVVAAAAVAVAITVAVVVYLGSTNSVCVMFVMEMLHHITICDPGFFGVSRSNAKCHKS